MATFTVYNTKGEQVGTTDQPALFSTPIDRDLIQRYFTWVRSMLRHTIANTKTRGEISGGGKKPWKQKGTGRARVGSSRSPIWRKGGTVFGPLKEQNWATRLPRGERRKALFGAFADKAEHNQVIILDSWTMDTPKTKEVAELLSLLPTKDFKKVLHLESFFTPTLFKSTNNLQGITSKTVQNTNLIDLLNHDALLMTKETLEQLNQHFTPHL